MHRLLNWRRWIAVGAFAVGAAALVGCSEDLSLSREDLPIGQFGRAAPAPHPGGGHGSPASGSSPSGGSPSGGSPSGGVK